MEVTAVPLKPTHQLRPTTTVEAAATVVTTTWAVRATTEIIQSPVHLTTAVDTVNSNRLLTAAAGMDNSRLLITFR